MRTVSFVLAVLALAACGEPNSSAPAETATAPAAAPSETAAAAPADTSPAASIAAAYDPSKQRFVWVLPPGIHGKGPWEFKAIVKHKGEVKLETALPLKPEMLTPGSRPEYPAGHEIIRLASDGDWNKLTADINQTVNDLIAKHGRGDGEVVMQNDLKVSIDPDHRKTYCVDSVAPEIHAYVEEQGAEKLVQLDVAGMAPMFQAVVKDACAS